MISVNFFQISSMLENARNVGGKNFNQIRKLEGTFSTEGTVCIKVIYVPLNSNFFCLSDNVCRTVNVFLNIGYSFN